MKKKVPVASSVQPLPVDFAEKVLELEISVDVENSLESLKSLLELYSQAMEYYESIKDSKFQFYSDRMHELLMKQNNLLLASHEEPAHRPSVMLAEQLKQKREADKAIKKHEETCQYFSRQVSLNLQSQNNSMLSRFNNRKSRNISADKKTLDKHSKFQFPFLLSHHKRRSSEGESDRSGGVSASTEAELFEKELEAIMEKSVMEKIETTHEIKKKYKDQIEEIQKMQGGLLLQQLIAELHKSMDEELSSLETSLENKRKLAISKIRENFHP